MNVNNKIYEAVFYQNLENPTPEITQEAATNVIEIAFDRFFKKYKKSVWFRICEIYGEYYIAMYYDNEYNKANGEDL